MDNPTTSQAVSQNSDCMEYELEESNGQKDPFLGEDIEELPSGYIRIKPFGCDMFAGCKNTVKGFDLSNEEKQCGLHLKIHIFLSQK